MTVRACVVLVQLYNISVVPFLQPAQDILYSSPASRLVNCCLLFVVILRFGKCTRLPSASSYRSLIEKINRQTARRRSRGPPVFTDLQAKHQPLTSVHQPDCPTTFSFILFSSLPDCYFPTHTTMGLHVQSLFKVKVNNF